MEEKSTVTTSDNNGFKVGDGVKISTIENRWYIRFWYFMTFRKRPIRSELFKIKYVESPTTLTISE